VVAEKIASALCSDIHHYVRLKGAVGTKTPLAEMTNGV